VRPSSHAPDGISFPLEPGEQVELRVRRHWTAFWPDFIALLLAGALPAGFALGLLVRIGEAGPLVWRIALAAACFWVGLFLLRAVLCKRRHDREIYVITDRRVVSVHQAGMLRYETSSISLGQIVEVRSRVTGVLAALLRYGDVEFRTRAGQGGGLFQRVGHPHAVAMQLQQATRIALAGQVGNGGRPTPAQPQGTRRPAH
jgi:hypothetical protein